jgi:hypothetical protein
MRYFRLERGFLFPQGYGKELYDHDGKTIGYLGIDYRRGFPISQVNEMKLLQQT